MKPVLNKKSKFLLVVLRMAIGWHFLYESIHKLTLSDWSAKVFLLNAKGPFDWIFHSIAENQNLIVITDYLIPILLFIIGLGLILGLFTQISLIGGMILLVIFYLATPPFPGLVYNHGVEGNYLIVNKNFIEFLTMLFLFQFNSGKVMGLDRILHRKQN